jgi:hypothetical protein
MNEPTERTEKQYRKNRLAKDIRLIQLKESKTFWVRATWCSVAVMILGPVITVYAIHNAIYEMFKDGEPMHAFVILTLIFVVSIRPAIIWGGFSFAGLGMFLLARDKVRRKDRAIVAITARIDAEDQKHSGDIRRSETG